ncbi:MAG: cobalamin-independent methionine synthase II family protein [Chloroflexota bacterium]|nr:cobalamin-independent methionine synthase II family protein [Chloroflexota bacterium]
MSQPADVANVAVRDGFPRLPARAETVGSLLRPPVLRQAMAEVYDRGHTGLLVEEREKDLSRLHHVEDEAIAEAVKRQIGAGLDVVTDGEFRRYMFTNSFYDAVEGMEPSSAMISFVDERGDRIQYAGPPMPRTRLRKVGNPTVREIGYLRSLTDFPFKVTFPAASWFTFPFWWRPGVTDQAYESPEEMLEHILAIERELVAEAIAAGATYLQFDFPIYPFLLDEGWRNRLRRAEVDLDALLDRAMAADRAILDEIPAGVTRALHFCRGNHRSHWLASGSIEPIAERLFSELPYDRFLIEWEDPSRDGGYEPLRHVSAGPTVVMGIVSTKKPELESADVLLRQLDEASRYLDLDQLAISPQCGFASTLEGNSIDEETQWRKLELVGQVADSVWGRPQIGPK